MSDQKRRDFVKLTGGVIGFGAVVSSSGSVAAATTQEDLPPLRGPYADEDWVEHRGGPGNVKAIEEAPSVDPDSPDCSHFYDQAGYRGDAAIADDTMYLVDEQGRIVAIDAHDATERWTSDELGVSGTPTLAYHRIIAKGDGKLVALDVDDRSVDWEREFDDGPSAFVAAYETVYVVAEETLYALDVEDGSVRWTRDDEKYHSGVAAGNGEVYATPTSREYGEDYHDIVAIDAGTGELRWVPDRDNDAYRGLDFFGPIAAEGAVSVGVDNDERMVIDTETREKIADGLWGFSWAMDDESIVAVDNYSLQVFLYRERESWDFAAPEIGRISDPAVAGDTVFVYYGEYSGSGGSDDDYAEYQEYEYSLLAFDKHDGDLKWTCEVQESDEDDASIWFDIVATSDAVYVLGDEEIYVAPESDGDEDDNNEDDNNEDDNSEDDNSEDDSTGEDDSTEEDDSTTPDDTPTPEDSEKDCGCPDDTDSTSGGDDTPTDTATATDDGTSSGKSTESSDEDHQPVENGTATEETDGAGPGLGIASAVASLGGIGYVLRRRLRSSTSEEEH